MSSPILKYPGSKRKVAGALLDALRADGHDLATFRVFDAFVGAGSYGHALLDRVPNATLSGADASPFVQDWWLASADAADEASSLEDAAATFLWTLRETIDQFDPKWGASALTYAKLRDAYNDEEFGEDGPIMAMVTMYLLNRMGFNGLVRFNAKGKYNVPAGTAAADPKAVYIPPSEDVIAHLRVAQAYRRGLGKDDTRFCLVRQEGVTGHAVDLAWMLCTPKRLVILDPPYLGGFVGYAPSGWTAADLRRTVRVVMDRWLDEDDPELLVLAHEHTGGEAATIYEAAGLRLRWTWNRAGTINSNTAARGPRQEGVWFGHFKRT